jgi:hypothetical protein
LTVTLWKLSEEEWTVQRLLTLLQHQHKEICANDQIENVAIVMGKLPQYIRKVQDIKAAMTEISSSIERMKKRSESLRVDAQSRKSCRVLPSGVSLTHCHYRFLSCRCHQEGKQARVAEPVE